MTRINNIYTDRKPSDALYVSILININAKVSYRRIFFRLTRVFRYFKVHIYFYARAFVPFLCVYRRVPGAKSGW